MQGFRNVMSDVQIATLASYLTKLYANPQANVTPDQVRTLRSGGAPSSLILLARGGLSGLVLLIVVAMIGMSRSLRRSQMNAAKSSSHQAT